MSGEAVVSCARCRVPKGKRVCDSVDGAAPRGCPTRDAPGVIAGARTVYANRDVRTFARHASCQEAAGYSDRDVAPRPALTRIEETCEFAKRAGFRRLGLAFCAGLLHEAEALDHIFTSRGFEVVSVVCKFGGVPKEELGLEEGEKVRPGCFETMCNPIAQAELLNRVGTDLNVMLGLCVGHDALFLQYATAPCTVLAVKDRVLGHNPLAALYTAGSYYRRLAEDGAPQRQVLGGEAPSRGREGRASRPGKR
jgi:uncharacterized metal-binding protein